MVCNTHFTTASTPHGTQRASASRAAYIAGVNLFQERQAISPSRGRRGNEVRRVSRRLRGLAQIFLYLTRNSQKHASFYSRVSALPSAFSRTASKSGATCFCVFCVVCVRLKMSREVNPNVNLRSLAQKDSKNPVCYETSFRPFSHI